MIIVLPIGRILFVPGGLGQLVLFGASKDRNAGGARPTDVFIRGYPIGGCYAICGHGMRARCRRELLVKRHRLRIDLIHRGVDVL